MCYTLEELLEVLGSAKTAPKAQHGQTRLTQGLWGHSAPH